MTTRDPRFRDPSRPETPGHGREPTQSLSLDAALEEDPADPASLARGTHEVGRGARTKLTSLESPNARGRTPPPPGGPPPIPRAGTSSDEPYGVGSLLGSYKILEMLGRGGMGYVYRAEHVKLGREVALKLLRSDYAQRRDAVARFFQEARTVNRVRHRNIVDVTDFVELDDGTTFIIMELLSGESLGKWARTGIDLPRALAVLVQICDGLAAAHEVGVIHRDLKPDNVFVVPTADGADLVKLLDFGVAKLVNRDDEDVGFQTAAGSVIGTPAYMSPEQAGGMAVDPRSDIYSLGAIMYELFCGEPMFRGRSFGEYVRKHLTEMPVPPRQTAAGASLDPRLEALIMRCLEKDPIQRFPNILELRDALLAMLGGMETHLPGLAPLSASGVRPMANLGPSVQLAPLPQLPAIALQLPTPPSGAHSSSQISQLGQVSQLGHPSQQAYFGHTPPPTGARPATPWSVWFVGSAIAVGLGIAAAVWYASRTEIAPSPVAAGEPPVEQPAPIAEPAPQPVEVRFESTPPGAVFAEGNPAELCRTPCTHRIDPRDGGSPDRRSFVVRTDGHEDASIVVDLRGAEREFTVALAPRAEAVPEAVAEAEGPAAPTAVEGTRLRPGTRPGVRPRPGTRPAVKPRPDDQASKPDDKKPDDKKPGKRPDDADLLDPTAGRPAKKPATRPIDPADTLDPFRRK
jgi:serine/threonine protein kinase